VGKLKPLIIIILLTILIVAGGFMALYTLNSEAQSLDSDLLTLEEAIKNQNWDTASEKLEEFHSKWNKTSSLWSMLIDHYEIDNIELLISQLGSYVKNKDKNEALSNMSSLKTLIKHIPEKESLSLKNIF
jgi:predicted PurR-regulated permease PerM